MVPIGSNSAFVHIHIYSFFREKHNSGQAAPSGCLSICRKLLSTFTGAGRGALQDEGSFHLIETFENCFS